ncbi:hypothetical protein NC651_018162 [Populus alba x Populus x berolinensis]|nr:hypothetical protein NC651_018162 [Populus alba x Populus x berolinensis]
MDNELAPCVSFEGWIIVEPIRKSNKHICGTPKGKEVIAVEVVPGVNPCTELAPSVCADVVGSLGARALAGADVDSGTTSQLAPLNLGEGTPNDAPPLEELVTRNRKHCNSSSIVDSRRVSPPLASLPAGDG